MEKKTLTYILFGIFLTINMDCKTPNTTAQSVQNENDTTQALPCGQTLKIGDRQTTEKYTYKEGRLVKTERYDADAKLLFTEVSIWRDGLLRSKKRMIGDKAIYAVAYVYEDGVLKKQEIDDTGVIGELEADGKMDREEVFFYDSAKVLNKITIERKNMPMINVEIEYSAEGLETKRTMRSDKKVLKVVSTEYKGKKKTKSVVELRNGTALEYAFVYDDAGQLLETTRSGTGDLPPLRWTKQYNCESNL